jgi:hypothetical protein
MKWSWSSALQPQPKTKKEKFRLLAIGQRSKNFNYGGELLKENPPPPPSLVATEKEETRWGSAVLPEQQILGRS